MLAGATILMVSLVEVTFYFAATQSVVAQDLTLGLVANGLIRAVQHVFLVAPALLLPLGVLVLRARLLPRALGLSALALGATLQLFGLVGLFGVLQSVVDTVLIAQSVWFIAAGVAIMARPPLRLSSAGH